MIGTSEQRRSLPPANQFILIASVIERDVLRYSPAGVPIVSGKLRHSSQQTEAEGERTVEFEIPALAIGEIAGRFGATELGEAHCFTGFMARKNRNSKSLVFHITDFSSVTD